MKKQAKLIAIAAALAFIAAPSLKADDKHNHNDHAAAQKADKAAKPYPLKTCVVSDEEIGKDPDMKPHVFTHDGQEVKLCCKGCLKDFNKEPAKYLKKIEDAQKKK